MIKSIEQVKQETQLFEQKIRKVLNEHKLPSNEKRIIQKDFTGKIINIFKSMCEAERITGISKQEISKVCTGYRNRKIAKGFKWEFEGDPRD